MIRRPAAAGMFYPSDKDELTQQMEACFDGLSPKAKYAGGIVPHAGYVFSGKCAARFYASIDGFDNFLILGFSHRGYGKGLCASSMDWQTPLGVAEFDKRLAESIREAVTFDEKPHIDEHSIEVQVPFLQHRFGRVRMVAVAVGDDVSDDAVAILKNAIGPKTCVIASSDFTHFGPSYGFVPFTKDVRKNVERLDRGAIDLILKGDWQGFSSYLDETGATICGNAPIALITRLMDGRQADLLSYYTSSDITGDINSVSYASIGYR